MVRGLRVDGPGARRALPVGVLWGLAAMLSLWTFGATVALAWRFAQAPPAGIEQDLARLEWSHSLYFAASVSTFAGLFAVFFFTGAAIFWLRPRDRMAFFTSIFLIALGASLSAIPTREFTAFAAQAPASYTIPAFLCNLLSFGMLAVFFAVFPDGRFFPRWMRWFAALGVVLSVVWGLFPDRANSPGAVGLLVAVASVLLFAACIVAQARRYRSYATAVQKQQTKWFVLGSLLIIPLGVAPFIVLNRLGASTEADLLLDLGVGVAMLSFGLLPASIGVAILRYRLWDIDVIIRRTLQYAVLSALLALVYFASVVMLQSLFSSLAVERSPLAVVLSTLLIAALFTPLRRQVQELIDRRFFRKKYDAQQTLLHFARTARDEVALEALSLALLAAVEETMQPAQVSLWLAESRAAATPGQPAISGDL